jgi:hypothetical protein
VLVSATQVSFDTLGGDVTHALHAQAHSIALQRKLGWQWDDFTAADQDEKVRAGYAAISNWCVQLAQHHGHLPQLATVHRPSDVPAAGMIVADNLCSCKLSAGGSGDCWASVSVQETCLQESTDIVVVAQRDDTVLLTKSGHGAQAESIYLDGERCGPVHAHGCG